MGSAPLIGWPQQQQHPAKTSAIFYWFDLFRLLLKEDARSRKIGKNKMRARHPQSELARQ